MTQYQTTTLTHNHKWYNENYEKNVPFSVYKKIIQELNSDVIEYLLLGGNKKFKIPYHLGYIQVLRFDRSFKIKNDRLIAPINWGQTKKLRKEGKLDDNKFIYYTDKYYVGFYWNKKNCNVKGSSMYKFDSSRTNGTKCKTGAKNKLTERLRSDPEYYLRFDKITVSL
jgi:hypothetical protein